MKNKKSRNILINDQKLLDAGFLLACDAVATTLGAEGGYAILDSGDKAPAVSKDGVSLMQNIRFEDKTMNFGAIQAIAGASRTLEKSGDSTTTTAVFMQGYIRKLKRSHFNKAVERGILKGVEEVYTHMSKLAKKASKKELKQICKVACNNDETLATVIMEGINYAGEDGITECIISSNQEITTFEKQDGYILRGHGYASPYFANENDKKICFKGDNVSVLISCTWDYNQTIISKIQEFYSGVERSTPLLIILERPNSEMLEKLIGIKKVGFNLCLIYANEYDEYNSELLIEEVSSFVGATPYNPRTPESKVVFGIADKVVVTLEDTTLIVNDVPNKFKEILETLEKSEKRDERRIKRMKTKTAVISVGGKTTSEKREVGDRVDDALSSIKTTIAEGHLCGGGGALVYISGLMNTDLKHAEEQRGYNLVRTTLKEPLLRILKNANRKNAKWYEPWKTDYIKLAQNDYGMAYNCVTDQASNLIEDGVIDSKKSLRVALESATERAIQQFNIKVICHFPEKMTLEE